MMKIFMHLIKLDAKRLVVGPEHRDEIRSVCHQLQSANWRAHVFVGQHAASSFLDVIRACTHSTDTLPDSHAMVWRRPDRNSAWLGRNAARPDPSLGMRPCRPTLRAPCIRR